MISEFTPSGGNVNKDKTIFIPNIRKITSTIGVTGSPYWYEDYNYYNRFICEVQNEKSNYSRFS